ncbi:MAG: SIR2 family protein, partial [bacterium]|nr:SIR2 family protein [bacterium]
PLFRSSRLEVDMHYNPPGIRGEPRYLEGVVHFTKLHGSLDWIYQDGYVRRIALPFGAESINAFLPTWGKEKADTRSLLIYPNEAKDRETAEYPYVELFRDFAAAVCRPNSTLVLYGYSLGDEHINRIIKDMLTIPSTHLVIIAYGDDGDRVKSFYNEVHRPAQISLLIGKHFGNLEKLVEYYLPKPAIDRTTFRLADLMRARGIASSDGGNKNNDTIKEGINESKPD